MTQAAQVERQPVEGERRDLLVVDHRLAVASMSHCKIPLGQTPSTRVPRAAITAAARPQPSMSRPSGCFVSGCMKRT